MPLELEWAQFALLAGSPQAVRPASRNSPYLMVSHEL